ncbi:MAG: histidine kinase [Oribacterium sp.]
MSLWKKISVVVVSIIIIITISMGIASYGIVQKLIIKNKKEDMENMLNLIDINITEQIGTLNNLVDFIADSESLPNALSRDANIDKRNMEDLEYLGELVSTFEAVNNLYIINDSNELLYQYKEDSFGLNIDEIAAYIERARNEPNRSIWANRKEGDSIILLTNIGSADSASGMLAIAFDPETFAKLLINNLSTFRHQYTLIVDKEGNTICSNNSIKMDYLKAVQERYDAGERSFQFQWAGISYFACGQYNGITGWKILSVIAADDIFPQLRILKRSIYFIVIAAVVMGFLISVSLAWTVTKPMQRLSDAMKETRAGNFDIRIHTRRKDEIGTLIDSYNYMIDEINRLVNVVYEEKMAQKTAEIGALQAQINPHFLYNTLDTINWMLLDRGEEDISDIIINLGELMKYSIAGNNALVSLEEEIKYIHNYLKIQKCRMEDKLKYTISISEECRECKCPKLILQPIVENAIKHGIEPMTRTGEIAIHAIVENEDLRISLADNGRGMTEEEIKGIYLGESGIGLNNVIKRIKLIYGQKYGLTIISEKNEGTNVEITIPAVFEVQKI